MTPSFEKNTQTAAWITKLTVSTAAFRAGLALRDAPSPRTPDLTEFLRERPSFTVA